MTDERTPSWLHGHAHEPNPEPPTADPSMILRRSDGSEILLTPEDLQRLPQCEVADCYIVSTGHGTSGPFCFAGPRLLDLLQAHLGGQAWSYVDVVSADGFGNRVTADELRASTCRPILLAIARDGKPLQRAQGLVRLIVPDEREDALRQVKWVTRLDVH